MSAWKRLASVVIMEKLISRAESWLNIIGVMLIVVIMLLTVVDVVGRYFFNSPLYGAIDISEIAMAGIVYLGLAYTLKNGTHVRVELFVNMLKGRIFHLTEVSTLLLSLFLFAITFFSSLQFTIKSWEVGDCTPQLWWPTWPAKLSLTLGAFFICLRLIIQIIQHLSQTIAGRGRESS